MTAENRALPLISPVARYDPPTICLDKDESLAEDDLNNGPGMDETINDVLDKLDIGDRKPRRDTNVFHREILVGAVSKLYICLESKGKISSSFKFTGELPILLIYILTSALIFDNIKENTKKQAARKHYKSPSKKPLPLRTSTQVC